MKSLSYFLISFLLVMEAKAMDHAKEYQFGVRWSVNGIPGSLRTHNILLSFDGSWSHLDRRLPMSQYIKNGKNILSLSTWPLEYDLNNKLGVSLLYWEPEENPNTEAKTAFEVVMFPGKEHAEPEIVSHDPAAPLQPRDSEIRFHRYEEFDTLQVSFNNHQPMPTWCWEQGDVLQDNAATRDSLTQAYRRLHALFEAKDNDAIMEASSTMIQELAQASGEPEEYVRHRASFNMLFDNPDVFQLHAFPEDPMTLNLGGDNRVAWLTTRGVSVPITFDHVQEQGRGSSVRLYFIRRDGQWEICR